jgi:hypothetical protein
MMAKVNIVIERIAFIFSLLLLDCGNKNLSS